MGLFSIIEKGIQAMLDEAKTPDSIKKGREFEDYVRHYLFTKDHYTIVDRTHEYDQYDYIESCGNPDFKFRDKYTGKEFYVEAKFRSNYNEGKLLTFKKGQLERYRKHSKDLPVFIILGFGPYPDLPRLVSLIPIWALKQDDLYYKYAKSFEIRIDKPLESSIFWKRC